MYKNNCRRPVRLSAKILVFFLLVTLLSNTVLAVPETARTALVSVSEIGQDIRFGYGSSSLGATIGGWIKGLGFFLPAKPTTPDLARIEIVPGGDLTVRQGEPVNFTAFAYAPDGRLISGLKFDWSIEDSGRSLPSRNLPDGTFQARRVGNFIVKATARGFQDQINLVVEENRPWVVMQQIREAEANGNVELITRLKRLNRYRRGEISSTQDYQGRAIPGMPDDTANVTENDGVQKDGTMTRPADEDGWGNGNWWMADDPANQVGNPPGTSPDLGAGNGNFQFSAPVVSLPGRGIDLSLSLNYNSRVWSKAGNVMSFDSERGFPAPGWNLGFGKMMFMGTGGGCMLIDADGTNRGYTGTISNYNNNGSYTYFTGYTTDGSFIDYSCNVSTYNGVTSMTGQSKLPSGVVVNYSVASVNGKQAFPSQIADVQGNYINITYRNNRGPHIQTVTDTLGRVVTFNYDSSDRLISVGVPKFDGGTRTAVRLHYKQLTLSPGWASGITSDTNNSAPYVVDAIYYPGTGTGYWFNETDSYSSYGMISKVIEQRGMSWSGSAGDQGTVTAGTMSKQAEYNYPLTPLYTLTDAPTYSTLKESWAGMDTAPVETLYNINMSSSPRTITVTKPNGVKSKQYMYNASGLWYDGLIYQDDTLDASNNQLSKSVVQWEQGAYSSPRPTQTDITDERLQVLKTTYTYGSAYNQLISQKKYAYDGTTLVQETRNTYESSANYLWPHIFSLVKSAEIYDGSGNRVSKTDYEYDNNAVVTGTGNQNYKSTPDVGMHFANRDPYTTEQMDGPTCISSHVEYEWQDDGYGGGSYVPVTVCDAYEQVSVYNPGTEFRGNLTKTTVYSDAAAATGSIAQTKQY